MCYILGFLRPGLQPSVISNFGLLDQVAAIHWLRENVKQFRGDPNSITLVGHGTGAAMVSLLLSSPVAQASEGIVFLRVRNKIPMNMIWKKWNFCLLMSMLKWRRIFIYRLISTSYFDEWYSTISNGIKQGS